MYGLGGRRGIIRTRILSFSLYVAALLLGAIIIPLVLAGPTLLGRLLPDAGRLPEPAVLAGRVAAVGRRR